MASYTSLFIKCPSPPMFDPLIESTTNTGYQQLTVEKQCLPREGPKQQISVSLSRNRSELQWLLSQSFTASWRLNRCGHILTAEVNSIHLLQINPQRPSVYITMRLHNSHDKRKRVWLWLKEGQIHHPKTVIVWVVWHYVKVCRTSVTL